MIPVHELVRKGEEQGKSCIHKVCNIVDNAIGRLIIYDKIKIKIKIGIAGHDNYISTYILEWNLSQIDIILVYSLHSWLFAKCMIYCHRYAQLSNSYRKQTWMNIIMTNIKNVIGDFTVNQFNPGKHFLIFKYHLGNFHRYNNGYFAACFYEDKGE